MYENGTAKIIPSILSNNPPWPGNIFPVSLIFAKRLKKEIIKSPNWLISEIIKIINNVKKLYPIPACSYPPK